MGQIVQPVSFFLHEGVENYAFSLRPGEFDYPDAHNFAINSEANIRHDLNIKGGFAGAFVDIRVPKK